MFDGSRAVGKTARLYHFFKRHKKTSATDHGYLHKTEANQLWELQVLFLYPYLLPDEESKNRGISDENLLQIIKLHFPQGKNSESSRINNPLPVSTNFSNFCHYFPSGNGITSPVAFNDGLCASLSLK